MLIKVLKPVNLTYKKNHRLGGLFISVLICINFPFPVVRFAYCPFRLSYFSF